MKNVACKGETWGKCAALGDALRRASEAEARVEELERRLMDAVMQRQKAKFEEEVSPIEGAAMTVSTSEGSLTPAADGCCPICSSAEFTTRGLKPHEAQDGWVVCSGCYVRRKRG
jgi:hypothetical protein